MEAFEVVGRYVLEGVDAAVKGARRVSRSADDARSGMKRFGGRVGSVGDKLRTVANRMQGPMSRGFAAVRSGAKAAAGVVSVLAGSIAAITTHSAKSTEEINRFAKRLGVSTEYLSEMAGVAGQFGVDQEAMIDGMKELSLRTDEFAKTGKGPAADAFAAIGVSAERANAMSHDTAALFDTIRGKISQVQNVAERQRLADELFGGQGGEQMIEMLQLSRAEMHKMRAEARKSGASVTSEQAAIARKFTQSFNKLRSTASNMIRLFGIELMPTLTRIFTEVRDKLISSKDQVKQFGQDVAGVLREAQPAVEKFFKSLTDPEGNIQKLVDLGTMVAEVVAKIVEAFLKLPDPVQRVAAAFLALNLALGPLSGALVTLATKGIATLGAAFPGLVSGFAALSAAALPIIATILAVVAAVTAAVLIFKNWDKIVEVTKAAVAKLWDGLKEFAASLVSAWKSAFETSKELFGRLKEALVSLYSDAWDAVKEFGRKYLEFWKSLPGRVADALKSLPGAVWGVLTDLGEGIVDWAESVADAIAKPFEKLKNLISGAEADANSADVPSGTSQSASSAANSAARSVSSAGAEREPVSRRGSGEPGGRTTNIDMRGANINSDQQMQELLRDAGAESSGAYS